MADSKTPERADRLGLTDDKLVVHRTAFAYDVLKDMAVRGLVARRGAHVVLGGRNQERLDALVSNLTGRKLKASAYAADIKDPDAVKSLLDSVYKTHGRVDGLMNSAGAR